jgi:hypothetical protein
MNSIYSFFSSKKEKPKTKSLSSNHKSISRTSSSSLRRRAHTCKKIRKKIKRLQSNIKKISRRMRVEDPGSGEELLMQRDLRHYQTKLSKIVHEEERYYPEC